MHRSRLARNVLSGSEREHQEAAARELLDAVRELFPGRFAELETRWREIEGPPDSPEPDPDELDKAAREWTLQNGISCDAVNYVLSEMAQGRDWSEGGDMLPGRYFDKRGKSVKLPSISAEPSRETLKEFVRRAGKHYQQQRALFVNRGYKRRPVKREFEHFRYLAAHLVGGHSLQAIEDGRTPFNFPEAEYTAITSGVRQAARLIGLSLPSKPGPRPRSRAPRRRPRRP